ncbi:MAG: fibronectin type III domain-containing protein, partial [Bacteroidia bacterium]|nr:fibronectin type III domain-containing protein [Bacteroidia bacterium]
FETTPCPVPPPNDQCINAIPLTLGVPQAGTTINASPGANPTASCDMYGTKNDVWYKINAGDNVALDIQYSVQSGTIEANFSMDCNAVDLGVCYSPVPARDTIYGFPLNTDIYMRIWSNPGAEGNFTVTVTAICDNPTATISGGGAVCTGDPLPQVDLNFTGTSPWNVILTNGSKNDTINNITTNSQQVTPSQPGNWTIMRVTDAFCLGTPSGTASAIWNPLPQVNASANAVCAGGTLMLTGWTDDILNSGFMWSGPNGFSSNDQNPTIPNVDNLAEGDYILTVLSFNTNCVNSDTVTVSLGVCNTCPTPTNLRVVNLSAYSATLDWDLPTGPPYTTPDSVVTYFRLVGAVNWQRRVWTDIDSIRIFKLKPDNQAYEWKIAVYCNGTPLPRVSGPNFTTAMACVPASNLVASGVTNNQATITWDAASIADSFYVNYRKTGGIWLFKVAMTNSATLTGLSANTTYEVKVKTFCNTGAFTGYAAMGSFTTNVSKTDDFVSDISAYPNPMHDILVITAMPEIDSKLEVSFVNILGVTVKRYQETVTTGSIVREISVSDLETGIYMVEISCGDVRRVVKIVKE